jgi:hypothetical protein
MRTRRQATVRELREVIECLPRHTRVAMLEGIATNQIIVGAYANRDGVCPMLAAHQHVEPAKALAVGARPLAHASAPRPRSRVRAPGLAHASAPRRVATLCAIG